MPSFLSARTLGLLPLRKLASSALVLALGFSACDGPTLGVASRREAAELDAGESDEDDDASSGRGDAMRGRDAQYDDIREAHLCRDNRDCNTNSRRLRCNPYINRCVECVEDRECFSNRCGENSDGLCKEPDRDNDKPRP